MLKGLRVKDNNSGGGSSRWGNKRLKNRGGSSG